MRPLRAFFILQLAHGTCEVTAHRELESVEEAWKARPEGGTSAAIHVGFWRPGAEAFAQTLSAWPGRVLLSSSTRHALPSGFAASALPVGEAAGLPLHLALSGWGYEIQDPSQAGTALHTTKCQSSIPRPFGDWCSALPSEDPQLAAAASASGVTDESSYLDTEPLLPSWLRDRLGRFRFAHLSGDAEPKAARILDLLQFTPPWLLSLPVSSLNLSVRGCNVLESTSIVTIGDLAAYGSRGVWRFANLGRKTYFEICERIVRAFSAGNASAHYALFLPGTVRQGAVSKGTLAADRQDEPLGEVGPASIVSLKTALEAFFSLLTLKEQQIMKMRIGVGGAAATLQEIGDVVGVTRERIRQIESRAVAKLRQLPYWNSDLPRRLDALLEGREDCLPLEGLEVLDPWFKGAADSSSVFGYVAELIPETPFHLVREGPLTFVSRASQDDWDAAIITSRRLLAGLVGTRTTLADARALVDGLLTGNGEELRHELWHSAARHAHFADEGSGPILVSYGFGANHLVQAELSASDRPLHFTEIHARLVQSQQPCDVRRVHNAAAAIGLLYGRGIYGAERHFPLDEAETKLVVSETEDIVGGYAPGRQWHAREICDALEERGFEFGGRLDPYVVSLALRGSIRMTYLGRMVWVSSASGTTGSANRLDVHQAIVSILEDAGAALSTYDVRARLSRERGLNCYFQIQPEGQVVRLGVGMWGLMARDLPFSENEASDFVWEIRRILTERCKGLHISEIYDAVSPRLPAATKVLDPALFIGLAQKNVGFSVAKGQYLYLSEWGGSRRLTIGEAVASVLEEAGPAGLRSEEGAPRIASLIERPFPKSLYAASCRSAGAIYSAITGRWHLPSEDDGEDEDA